MLSESKEYVYLHAEMFFGCVLSRRTALWLFVSVYSVLDHQYIENI